MFPLEEGKAGEVWETTKILTEIGEGL